MKPKRPLIVLVSLTACNPKGAPRGQIHLRLTVDPAAKHTNEVVLATFVEYRMSLNQKKAIASFFVVGPAKGYYGS